MFSLSPSISGHNPFNPLNAELNPICHLLALLGGATIVVVSRLRVKLYSLQVQSNAAFSLNFHNIACLYI